MGVYIYTQSVIMYNYVHIYRRAHEGILGGVLATRRKFGIPAGLLALERRGGLIPKP